MDQPTHLLGDFIGLAFVIALVTMGLGLSLLNILNVQDEASVKYFTKPEY